MNTLTPSEYKEAKERINEKLQEAYAAIAKAQDISIETGVSFEFGVTYGAGAAFYPEDFQKVDEDGYTHDGWSPSSVGC